MNFCYLKCSPAIPPLHLTTSFLHHHILMLSFCAEDFSPQNCFLNAKIISIIKVEVVSWRKSTFLPCLCLLVWTKALLSQFFWTGENVLSTVKGEGDTAGWHTDRNGREFCAARSPRAAAGCPLLPRGQCNLHIECVIKKKRLLPLQIKPFFFL